MERRFAGARRGDMLFGLKHFERRAQRMTVHWIDNGAGRFFWCDCMPAFRVGAKVHHPGRVIKSKSRGQMPRQYWHRERL